MKRFVAAKNAKAAKVGSRVVGDEVNPNISLCPLRPMRLKNR